MARKDRLEQPKVPRGSRGTPGPVLLSQQLFKRSWHRSIGVTRIYCPPKNGNSLPSSVPYREASGALLVRMVMRQGSLFRLSRLRYPEIGEDRGGG